MVRYEEMFRDLRRERKKVYRLCILYVHAIRVWICIRLCFSEREAERLGEIKRCEWVGLCQQKRILFEIHHLHFSSTKSKTYGVCSLGQSGGRSELCRREEKWQERIENRIKGWCMWRREVRRKVVWGSVVWSRMEKGRMEKGEEKKSWGRVRSM